MGFGAHLAMHEKASMARLNPSYHFVSSSRSPPARQQRERVVALDAAQISLAEAELEKALHVFHSEPEREIGAPEDLRDRRHSGQRAEAARMGDLGDVVVETNEFGHDALRHVRVI